MVGLRRRTPGRAVHSRPGWDRGPGLFPARDAGTEQRPISQMACKGSASSPRSGRRRVFRRFGCQFVFFFWCHIYAPTKELFVSTKFPLIFTVVTSEFITFKSTEFMESVEMLADVLLTCRERFQTIRSFDF